METAILLRPHRVPVTNEGPDAFKEWIQVPAGTQVEIVARESHGQAPHTRWAALVQVGGRDRRLPGLVRGQDFGPALTAAENAAALREAYHAVYDAKDKLPAGNAAFYAAYEALGKIADLMTLLGHTPPSRHDGEGRP